MELKMFGQTFQIGAPYAEGQTINAAEAKTLNQIRKENISNNVRKKLGELAGEGKVLLGAAIDQALALVSKADSEYVFTLASVGAGKRIVDPVEKEAMALARAFVSAKLAEKGIKVKDYDKDKLAAKIAEVAATDKVQAIAKKNVAGRKGLDLDIGDI